MEQSEAMNGVDIIEAVSDWLEENRPATPYAYKTRVNLVGNEIVEFMVNRNGAVRYFVAPMTVDETTIKTFIRQIERETK